MIDVVIVAAGKGSRLQPFTSVQPKALVPIKGKPLIQHQIDTVKNFDVIKNYIIVVGHQGITLRKYLFAQNMSLMVVWNTEYDKTECGFSLIKGLRETNNDVLSIIGDILFTKENVMKLIYNKDNCLLVRPPYPAKLGQKVVMYKDNVKDIGLGGIHSFDGEAVGPFKLKQKDVKSLIELYDNLDEDSQKNIHCYSLLGLWAKKHTLKGIFINDDEWMEIDTHKDWELANSYWTIK